MPARPAPRPPIALAGGLLALGLACASTRGPVPLPAPGPGVRGVAPSGAPVGGPPPDGARHGALEIGDPYYPGLGNGGYDVEHYGLELELDMDADEVSARATLRARALHELASFALDLYGLEVQSVHVVGQPARFERPLPAPAPDEEQSLPPSELVIHPAAPVRTGAIFTTDVRYVGTPDVRPDPSVPFFPGVGWARRESGVYVVSECIGASSWFPCNDHPRDKATFDFRVTVAKPYTAAANGILRELLEEGERRTFVFTASDPMATYLATLNVAEFAVLAAEGPRGIPIRTYHPTDASAEELADFRRQGEVLDFLETVFGPYPFESAGAVIAYENIGGALECQTLPVYGRGCDLPVIVHELAHQWYGDCVSPDLWRDMWLNEGFASYAEWLWIERQGGKEAYEQHARETYHRLRQRQTGSPYDPGVERVFSQRVYARGAMVLYGLRAEVGDEAFFRILKEWVVLNHDENGSTQEFVAHAARVAGRDLAAFFDAWLFAAVTPPVPAFGPDEPEAERPRRERRPETAGGG